MCCRGQAIYWKEILKSPITLDSLESSFEIIIALDINFGFMIINFIIVFLVFCFMQCIVKSYLNWLQDSDYNPVCTLCNGSLAEGDVVRLICFGKEQVFLFLQMQQWSKTQRAVQNHIDREIPGLLLCTPPFHGLGSHCCTILTRGFLFQLLLGL